MLVRVSEEEGFAVRDEGGVGPALELSRESRFVRLELITELTPDDLAGRGWVVDLADEAGRTIERWPAERSLRIFQGKAEHTENFLVYIPKPPAYAAIKYAVTASWPGNAKEPYMIDNFIQLSVDLIE